MAGRDAQCLGDLGVRPARRDLAQHDALLGGQIGRQVGGGSLPHQSPEDRDEQAQSGQVLRGERDLAAVEGDLADVVGAVAEADRHRVREGQRAAPGGQVGHPAPVHEAHEQRAVVVVGAGQVVAAAERQLALLDEVAEVVAEADADDVGGHDPVDQGEHVVGRERAPGHRLGRHQGVQRELLALVEHQCRLRRLRRLRRHGILAPSRAHEPLDRSPAARARATDFAPSVPGEGPARAAVRAVAAPARFWA